MWQTPFFLRRNPLKTFFIHPPYAILRRPSMLSPFWLSSARQTRSDAKCAHRDKRWRSAAHVMRGFFMSVKPRTTSLKDVPSSLTSETKSRLLRVARTLPRFWSQK